MESAWLAPTGGAPFAVVRVITDTEAAPIWHPGIVGRGIRALRTLRRAAPVLDAWAESVGTHTIALASPRSFCAGVERAIDIVDRALDRFGAPVYVRRQIVHNAHVVSGLERRGAVFVQEADEVPPGSVLVLAAHGVAPIGARRGNGPQASGSSTRPARWWRRCTPKCAGTRPGATPCS